jgi:hypothetical protein
VGKTALAVPWSYLARRHFPDGDFYFNLNGYSDGPLISPARVVDDLLISLGYLPNGQLDQRSRELLLRGILAGRRALVVLDNARDTAHVKDLISLMPSCVVVVTSRHRLSPLSATTGARRVRVDPLPDDEATELLSTRLGTYRHLGQDDRDSVVRLCGGLPLVITLLAEQIAGSGIARLSAFIEGLDRRKLLLGDDVDGSAITNAVLSWTLSPAEQRLFRLLDKRRTLTRPARFIPRRQLVWDWEGLASATVLRHDQPSDRRPGCRAPGPAPNTDGPRSDRQTGG